FYAHLGFCKEAATNFLNFFKAKLGIHGISGHCQRTKGIHTEFQRIVSVQKCFYTEFGVVVGMQKPIFTQNEACIGFHKQKRAFWRGIFMGGVYDKTFF
ncbi:MAG: hypothetical protein K2F89_02280, partial [Treponemataceae bacterium]|nr:hypothetical protein [Treponemataceae bacterium]